MRIESIEELDQDVTYDLETTNNHCFFANDILVHNCHKVSSNSYITLNTFFDAPIKIGMSGTLNPDPIEALLIEGMLGEEIQIIRPKELIDRGLATPVVIQPLFLQYGDEVTQYIKGLKGVYNPHNRHQNAANAKKAYEEEQNFFREYQPKYDFVVDLVSKLSKKGNGLIIAKNVDVQKKLYEELRNRFPNVELITGSTKVKQREQIRQTTDDQEDRIIVGSAQIVSTGINIRSLKWCVLFQVNKTEIASIQTLGRLLRTYEDKEKAFVFLLVNDCRTFSKRGNAWKNYGFKHFEEIILSYQKYDYEVEVPKVINIKRVT
jgi:superfamily II DNA or RNA helicase